MGDIPEVSDGDRSRLSHLICAGKRGRGSGTVLTLFCSLGGGADSPPPLLTLLWDVDQRTRVIGECCRVEDLDAGVVVAGECRCGTRTACLHGIVRRIEPNPEVINLHGAISLPRPSLIGRGPRAVLGKH